ncbi:MAG: NADH-quinone oxidoreductase subunit C [Conexivisphaerales archaeon]
MIEEKLVEIAKEVSGNVSRTRKSFILKVNPEKVSDACQKVAGLNDFYHLSTITGVDIGEHITVMYHFWKGRDFITVSTDVPKSNPHLPSISSSLPSSLLYEAEVKDLLGVIFDGNPLMGTRLILPDIYPEDAPPPLTKEADPEKIRKMMELE